MREIIKIFIRFFGIKCPWESLYSDGCESELKKALITVEKRVLIRFYQCLDWFYQTGKFSKKSKECCIISSFLIGSGPEIKRFSLG